jgi:hexokinase
MNISQLKTISANFTKELNDASLGKKTSLAFIANQLPSSPIVKDREVFQAFVAGGTNARIALIRKNKNRDEVLNQKEEHIFFKKDLEFLDFINNNLSDKVKAIGLNLAYPIKPVFAQGVLDGILIKLTKEGQFRGLEGKQVGKEISKYIWKKRNKKIKVSVANDTICLLASGLSQFNQKDLAAGIVGTGFNMAFFEDTDKPVNLEAANFDKFPISKNAKIIDRESSKPGEYLFEKEVSGAYLYKHFNLAIKNMRINFPDLKSTKELDLLCSLDIVSGPVNLINAICNLSEKDQQKVSLIARDTIKKSSHLVACLIAGLTNFKKKNMTFVMEGSLFLQSEGYKEEISKMLKILCPEYKIKFFHIKNSPVIGASKLIS